MKRFLTYFLLLLLMGSSGCTVFNHRQVREFDLAVKQLPDAGKIRVSAVRNLSNSGQSMLRRSGTRLFRDTFNIWAAEPGTLICNALNRALDKDGAVPSTLVFCDVDRFEADMVQQTFRLSGTYRKQGHKGKYRFDLTSELRSDSPAHIAEVASETVQKLAVRLSRKETK